MFECAFIYVAPGCDPAKQRAVIPSAEINMNVIGCATYSQAVEVAKEMVAKGCTALELCAGFGNEGIAMIKKAVGPDIAVGAIKFDFHPAFGFKSGDEIFDDTKKPLMPCGVPGADCETCPKRDFCPKRKAAMEAEAAAAADEYNLKDWMKTIK